jgi:alpha-L-rhamnosidase
VATGFAGTPIILHALAKAGQLHHAYRMLQSRDCPSWLSPILLGATTIWERWDSMLADGSINPGEMTSFNHYALGSVASFLHSVVGGLSPVEPGWKRIRIQPQPGGTITSATMSFNSPYGLVKCEWRMERNDQEVERLEVEIRVPPNTTAEVILPGLSETVGSGTRHYSVPWKRDLRFPPQGKEIAYGELPSDNWEP